jgi:hypothetical protein
MARMKACLLHSPSPIESNHERVIRSVANNTRRDGEEFLQIAA